MEERYWFRAKRYGWGWGLPATWEGWVVLLTFIALMALGAFVLPPERLPGWYFTYVTVVTVALVVVAWRKGEPPRWRWGGREEGE